MCFIWKAKLSEFFWFNVQLNNSQPFEDWREASRPIYTNILVMISTNLCTSLQCWASVKKVTTCSFKVIGVKRPGLTLNLQLRNQMQYTVFSGQVHVSKSDISNKNFNSCDEAPNTLVQLNLTLRSFFFQQFLIFACPKVVVENRSQHLISSNHKLLFIPPLFHFQITSVSQDGECLFDFHTILGWRKKKYHLGKNRTTTRNKIRYV